MGYFITDAAGQQVEACFVPLVAEDTTALNSDDWQGARFGEVWKVYAEHEVALKLVLCKGSDTSLLGIVKVGITSRINGGTSPLRNSLLETAPVYRHDTHERRYHGIGRVLIARLIVESKMQGAQGSLRVRPVAGSLPFYLKLGFVPVESNYCVLSITSATSLLTAVTTSAG